jgi:predicted  nucleic acid-binding Zn-ribbon protein
MYSVGNLITMIEQKDQEITQLHDRLKENEKIMGWGIQKGLEQDRLKDIQEIQKLNENLDEAKNMIQVTQEQVQALGNENKSLQDKIISIANQVIGIDQFKTKAS